jgi:hypothetical protein
VCMGAARALSAEEGGGEVSQQRAVRQSKYLLTAFLIALGQWP